MNDLLLHRAKSTKIGGLIAPAMIILGISFSLSGVFGLVVAIAMTCGFIASVKRIRSYIERRDLVLVITSTGLRRFVYDKEVDISWRDVEAMKTSHGKTGVFLHLKLAHPEQHMGKFARMNRCCLPTNCPSHFGIGTSLEGRRERDRICVAFENGMIR
jgi:hypothetical protein